MSNIGHPEKTCSNFFLASNFVAVATRETLHVLGGPFSYGRWEEKYHLECTKQKI